MEPEIGFFFNASEIIHIWRHENPFDNENQYIVCTLCGASCKEGWLESGFPGGEHADSSCHDNAWCDECAPSELSKSENMNQWPNEDDLRMWADIEKAIRGAQ